MNGSSETNCTLFQLHRLGNRRVSRCIDDSLRIPRIHEICGDSSTYSWVPRNKQLAIFVISTRKSRTENKLYAFRQHFARNHKEYQGSLLFSADYLSRQKKRTSPTTSSSTDTSMKGSYFITYLFENSCLYTFLRCTDFTCQWGGSLNTRITAICQIRTVQTFF